MRGRTLRERQGLFSHGTLLVGILCVGCSTESSDGLMPTRVTGGPVVRWDIEAKPLPDIPLPNNAATRLDPTSPTGRRLNISLEATTRFESTLRAKFNKLDGFGVSGPISVAFDRAIDIEDLRKRHANDDFRDDAIYVFNVDPTCQRFGEEVAMDLGRGRYPIVLAKHARPDADPNQPHQDGNRLFEFDPNGTYNNFIFEERNEDANQNGLLDPGEDIDDDGTLDVANLDDPYACAALTEGSVEYDRCIADHLLTFWERESNTLIMRPVWPLEQKCTHAVVLTNRLKDVAGRAVQSPFPAVNYRDQTEALRPIGEFLPRMNLGLSEVAFAFTFTTGSQTTVLETIRKGFYGAGPMARLASEYPVDSLELVAPDGLSAGAGKMFPGGCAGHAVNLYWQKGISEYGPNMCAFSADNTTMGGLIYGSFPVPYFVVDKQGRATPHYPDDSDESFELDPLTGKATYGTDRVTFWCSLPPQLDTSCSAGNPEGKPFCAPFPVAVYSHGYGSVRAEVTSYMGRQNALGMAACALDSPGHGGRAILAELKGLGASVAAELESYQAKNFPEAFFQGRDRDLNNDGQEDSGGDIYSADLFHTRDMLTQSALEFMQFVRILRNMDGVHKAKDGGILGDFDGDGKPDIGGSQGRIGLWGISMGGLITGILGGAEPAVDATVPISGGAGLTDVTLRSTVGGLPTQVFLPMLGPFVAGYRASDKGKPYDDGVVALSFLTGDVQNRARIDFGRVKGIAPGDRIELYNADKQVSRFVTVSAQGTFRVAVAADALGPLERRPLLLGPGDDEPILTSVTFNDTPKLGDRLVIRVYDGQTGARKTFQHAGTGEEMTEVASFLATVAFQGTEYPEGAPLVAMAKGMALRRNSPEFRRFIGIAQTTMDPADSAAWSPYYYEYALDTSYDPNAWPGRNHVLVLPTAGDMVVPVNTAITTARMAGLLGSWKRDPSIAPEYGWRQLFVPDPRYGESMDQHLISTHVMENLHRLRRYDGLTDADEAIYDIDNLSEGRSNYPCKGTDLQDGDLSCKTGPDQRFTPPGEPVGKGLRATHKRNDGTNDAMRIPYLFPHGQHGIWNAQKNRSWDADAHAVNFVSLFMRTGGNVVDIPVDCDCSASTTPTYALEGKPLWFAEDAPCDNAMGTQIRVCSASCAQTLGMQTREHATCP